MRNYISIVLFGLFFILMGDLYAQIDTLSQPVSTDSLFQSDSTLAQTDSLLQDSTLQDTVISREQQIVDSLRANSDLTGPVDYNARDSIIFDIDSSKLYLYGNSNLNYDQMALKAERVSVNWDTQTLSANGIEDSTGQRMGEPEFTQSGQTYSARRMIYNFKTEKGRIIGGRTAQGQDYLLSDTTKRFPDGSYFAKGTKFTTCDLDDPHYYINAPKVKVLPNNTIVSGPLNFVIADFPLPIGLPFGFIPDLKEGRRSGIIIPKYGEAQDRGFFLRDMGYYWGISDKMDLLLTGDVYTRGGWRVETRANFKSRNKLNAGLSLSYGVVRFGEREDPDFTQTAEWRLRGNISSPINPTTRLSGSANISSSSRYFRRVSFDANDFFQNDLASSINLSKTFNNLPFVINLNASHRQSLTNETVSMTFPSMTLSMNRLTPFKNLSSNRSLDFITRLGIDYNSQLSNQLTAVPDSSFLDVLFSPNDSTQVWEIVNGDSVLVKKPNSSFFRNGWRHTATASTGAKLFKFINLSANFRMTEYWYTESQDYFADPETRRVQTDALTGFSQARDFSTSLGATTNFFGIYQLTKTQKQIAFRQRFSPSISYSFRPDFSDPDFGFWEEFTGELDSTGQFVVDPNGDIIRRFNRFQQGIFGSPTGPESQSLGFSLTSVLEMKYRTKESFEPDFDEKKDEFERINILDNLSISSAYNVAIDSLNLSPIRMNARTTLFNKKLNINASATLDPYEINENGRRINQFIWDTRGKIGRLTNAQISLNTSLRSSQNKEKRRSEDFNEDEFQQIQNNLDEYVDFDIPWNIRMRYNLSYTRFGNNEPNIRQALAFNGDLSFTSNWKITFNSGFDFERKEFTYTSISILRDLHCWNLSFSWAPFGPLQSYVLVINVKSPTLRDLRLQKRNQFQDRRF